MSLESTVLEWLTRDEQLEFLLRENYWLQPQCLAITSARAILFRIGMFGRMRNTEDIQWRQLADVQVKEHLIRADLTIIFRSYNDCLLHHDPHHHGEGNHESSEQPKPWELSYLRRNEAKEAYRLLKEKEHHWKEILRKEHLEHDQAMGSINPRYVQPQRVEVPPQAKQPPYSGRPPLTS